MVFPLPRYDSNASESDSSEGEGGSDQEERSTTLRVVVFGADHAAGKVARAYSSLQRRESASPHLSRLFRLQFYFVPVRRESPRGAPPSAVSGLKR